jgi:hypothetical protein
MEPGAVASAVAREAGIQASQLFHWRQQLHGAPQFGSLTVQVPPDVAPITTLPMPSGSDRGRACVRGASTNQRRGGRSGRVGGHAGSGRLRPRLRVRGALSAAQHHADPLPCAVMGRPTRFTPERMQQVRNLVERGTELPLTQDRGVAGSTGPALTPGTWFVSQGDPWLHAFCAADRGRGFTSSDGLRRSLLRCADAASTTQDKGATD